MADFIYDCARLNTRRLVQRRGEITTTAMVPSTSVVFQGTPECGTVVGEMELQSVRIEAVAVGVCIDRNLHF